MKKKVCSATKRDGSACKAPAMGRGRQCWAHAPQNAAQRREIAARAGRSKGASAATTGKISEIKAALLKIADDVVGDKLTTAKGSVAAQVYGVLLRALEAERRERELGEVETEIAELRSMLGMGNNGR